MREQSDNLRRRLQGKAEPTEPAYGDVVERDGRLYRLGFFGWVPIEAFLRPTSWELTRAALRYTNQHSRDLRPFERVMFAKDALRSQAR